MHDNHNYNEILFERDAHKKLLDGATILTKAVKSTLGPKGRNVIIQKNNREQLVTKDGVTVAESIVLEDSFENLGAQLVREVATKTGHAAGDGTTTATVIAHALLERGQKLIESGTDPIIMKRGMDTAAKDIVIELQRKATLITSFKEIEQVGTISANNDKVIGSIIANAMEEIGKEGVITIEESNDSDTKLELVEGLKFDKGYISHAFVNRPERLETVFENPYICITNKRFTLMRELVPMLEGAVRANREILIIASTIEGEALEACIMNKLRNNIKVCCVRAPSFGDKQKLLLEDMAILTGGHFFDVDLEPDCFANINMDELGSARRTIISRNSTTIIDGHCDDVVLAERISTLNKQKDATSLIHDLGFLQERLANITGGIAVIKVGAFTEAELLERVARIEDALNATKAAVDEGIVPGAGLALLRASIIVQQNIKREVEDNSYISGYDLVMHACKAPFIQILENAGYFTTDILDCVNKNILEDNNSNKGFDSLKGIAADMFEEGIIDPCKVERIALENAVSVVGLLLTTNVLIVNAHRSTDSSFVT